MTMNQAFIKKENQWKVLLFFVYSVLLGIAVSRHEPWFDEAQAWLLARDASFSELMGKYLRYEGHPSLWYILLMIPAKLGLPYISLNIISAALSASGSYLFMRYSPFPLIIKLLYPFSYFAFYQYGIIARSYSLIPVLIFLIAIIYTDKTKRPFLFFSLLILLANVSFHGLIIAVSLALIHIFHVNNRWFEIKATLRYRNLTGFLVFGLAIFLIKLQLELPKDLISVAGIKTDLSGIFIKNFPALVNSLAVSSLIKSEYKISGNFFELLSVFAFLVTLYWFALRKKLLLYLVPASALFILFTTIYIHAWHTGILLYIWLFVLWVSFENQGYPSLRQSDSVKKVVTYTLTAILAIQSWWTLHSLRFDYSENYSASRDAANYIKENKLEDSTIYATNFHSISILPYFSSNIFCNYNDKKQPSFWIWSPQNSMYREPYLGIGKYDPDYILLGIKNYSPNKENIYQPFVPKIEGFAFKKLFPGALYWKDKPLESDSFALFEKVLLTGKEAVLVKGTLKKRGRRYLD